jgi:hypothetical protein
MEREIQVHQVQSLKIFLLCIAEEDSGAKDETQSLAEGERGRSVGRVWSAVVAGGSPSEKMKSGRKFFRVEGRGWQWLRT